MDPFWIRFGLIWCRALAFVSFIWFFPLRFVSVTMAYELREFVSYPDYHELSTVTLIGMYNLHRYSGLVFSPVQRAVFGTGLKTSIWLGKYPQKHHLGLFGLRIVKRVKQDDFHFDTVFPNLIYVNRQGYRFVFVLNKLMNQFIMERFSTCDPSGCSAAGAA